MYKVEFKWLTGTLKKISGILRLSFWDNVPASRSKSSHIPPSGEIWLDFGFLCQDFIMWLVYPITKSLSLTHSRHRNYHFTNPKRVSYIFKTFVSLKMKFLTIQSIYLQYNRQNMFVSFKFIIKATFLIYFFDFLVAWFIFDFDIFGFNM